MFLEIQLKKIEKEEKIKFQVKKKWNNKEKSRIQWNWKNKRNKRQLKKKQNGCFEKINNKINKTLPGWLKEKDTNY